MLKVLLEHISKVILCKFINARFAQRCRLTYSSEYDIRSLLTVRQRGDINREAALRYDLAGV